jgi:CRISPR-associated protein Csm1
VTIPRRPFPTTLEVALGAHLHDIGKFMQRAIGDVEQLPRTVRDRISDVLPTFDGRPSHFHALFSDAFFETCVDPNPLPPGLDRSWIRDCAVYHHRPLNDGVAVPNGAITYLVTEADRIAAAMERKKRDADAERSADPKVREKYRKTRVVAMPTTISLKEPPKGARPVWQYHPIGQISPDALFDLRPEMIGEDAIGQYQSAWRDFDKSYAELAAHTAHDVEGYVEGLIALSERFCWSVPSSTIDDPDVSLHDHGRVAAAVAACLHRHHDSAGDLKDESAVKDRDRLKFRLLVGDLSGIQASLFQLQSEGVKGLARLLRGRSFRMQLITEAAARMACRAFGLPAFNIIQMAGDRFLVLAPETGPDEANRTVDRLRADIDAWMREQYVGGLVLNLGLTAPLAAADLIDRLPKVYQMIGQVAEAAKLRPLETQALGVVNLPFHPDLGICIACGVRPAAKSGDLDKGARCPACHAETELGRRLVKAVAVAVETSGGGSGGDLILGQRFTVLGEGDSAASLAGFRRRGAPLAAGKPSADRFFEAHVPRHTEETLARPDLRDARRASEEDEPEVGDLITFAELAALSRGEVNGERAGRPMLALLKADVDNLGLVFSAGLGDRRSLSRAAGLSRVVNAFFTGWLPDCLRRRYRFIYTVYAGGDDLMLLGPWLDVLRFAGDLRGEFGRFAGGNENLTLSAGVALFDPRTPISLAASQADARLDAAKHGGDGKKDRVCAIGPADATLTWPQWTRALELADELHGLIARNQVSTALLYRLLTLDERRRKAATDPACADWRAKLGYTLYRTLPDGGGIVGNQSVRDRLFGLMGVGQDLSGGDPGPLSRIAITIALYRNR